jgi:3-deoxy-D-manno-octulosonic acid kinase
VNDATTAPVDAVRVATPLGAILFDARRLAQADADLLQPGRWQGAAGTRARGGRGEVRFVQGEFGAGVLRHYHRGGLFGRVNQDRYLWRGEDGTRSFREFRLLAALRARGMSVPAPIAAGYERHGAFYRADLLTALIPQASTLAERVADGLPAPQEWRRIGATLARFHREGVFHADLNAHNVMLDAQGRVWLIDFDRGELRPPAAEWARANLARLLRSLRKLGANRRAGWPEAWGALQEGYALSGAATA